MELALGLEVALGNRWRFQTGGVSGRFDCIINIIT